MVGNTAYADEKLVSPELKLDVMRYAIIAACQRDTNSIAQAKQQFEQYDLKYDQSALCNCVGSNLVKDSAVKELLASPTMEKELTTVQNKKLFGAKMLYLTYACFAATIKDQLKATEKSSTSQ